MVLHVSLLLKTSVAILALKSDLMIRLLLKIYDVKRDNQYLKKKNYFFCQKKLTLPEMEAPPCG